MSILACENLKKDILERQQWKMSLWHWRRGKIYALLGPNGSGKTTFMKMAAGLVMPTEGSIRFHDKPIGKESKKRVAYMSTEPFFYNYMTVKDVGNYYRDFFPDFIPAKFAELTERMDLKMTDKAKNLSSGLAAKLKLAATMARKAELYLLDEPLNGIDIIARDQVIQAVLEAASGEASIVMSSHLVDELEKVINDAIFMKAGRLVLFGEAEGIRRERGKSIVDLYKEIYA